MWFKGIRLPMLIGLPALVLLGIFWVSQQSGDLTLTGFQPHAQCLLYSPPILAVYSISDLLTGLSYMAISVALIVLVRMTRSHLNTDLPFRGMFWMFGAFIFFCGLTHFMDIITLWTPTYWASAFIRTLTAIASVATALAMPGILPRALILVDAARADTVHRQQLAAANARLQAEIEQRRHAEEELRAAFERESQLNAFRSQIISRLSHEFRTPMTVLQTSSDLLKLYFARMTDTQRTDRLNKMQNEVRYMTRMLNDILTMAQFETQGIVFFPQWINWVKLTEEVVDDHRLMLESIPRFLPHTIELHNRVDDCDHALLDPSLYQQIVVNLVQNALKYSPAHSNVTLDLECDEGHVVLTVRDQGVGISEKDMPYIFDSFYRGSNINEVHGTGVGLAIVRQAVDVHNGKIDVKSEIGVGTTFTVRLPVGHEPSKTILSDPTPYDITV